jgi:hypothetical protein
LRLIVEPSEQGSVLDAVAFQQGQWSNQLRVGDSLDLVFQLEINEWQGRQSLQMNVQDMRRAGSDQNVEIGTPPREAHE